jgi:hypothetical protein
MNSEPAAAEHHGRDAPVEAAARASGGRRAEEPAAVPAAREGSS